MSRLKVRVGSSESFFIVDFGGRWGQFYEVATSADALAAFFAKRQFLSSDGLPIYKIPASRRQEFIEALKENPYSKAFEQFKVQPASPIETYSYGGADQGD